MKVREPESCTAWVQNPETKSSCLYTMLYQRRLTRHTAGRSNTRADNYWNLQSKPDCRKTMQVNCNTVHAAGQLMGMYIHHAKGHCILHNSSSVKWHTIMKEFHQTFPAKTSLLENKLAFNPYGLSPKISRYVYASTL